MGYELRRCGSTNRIEELEQQLAEKDAEIERLTKQTDCSYHHRQFDDWLAEENQQLRGGGAVALEAAFKAGMKAVAGMDARGWKDVFRYLYERPQDKE